MFKTGPVSRADGGEETVPDGDLFFFWGGGEPRYVGELLLMQESAPSQNIKWTAQSPSTQNNLIFFFLIVLMIYGRCGLGLMCAELFISYCDVV